MMWREWISCDFPSWPLRHLTGPAQHLHHMVGGWREWDQGIRLCLEKSCHQGQFLLGQIWKTQQSHQIRACYPSYVDYLVPQCLLEWLGLLFNIMIQYSTLWPIVQREPITVLLDTSMIPMSSQLAAHSSWSSFCRHCNWKCWNDHVY